MTNVVAFRPEQTSRTMVRRDDEGARILFFTGVRYVRDDLPATLAEPEARPKDARAEEGCDGYSTERLKA